jgi:hypothetical protein
LTARNSGAEATGRATIPGLVAKAQIVCPLAIPKAVNTPPPLEINSYLPDLSMTSFDSMNPDRLCGGEAGRVA